MRNKFDSLIQNGQSGSPYDSINKALLSANSGDKIEVIASQQSSFCELTENYKLLQKRMDISQATLDRKSIKLLLKAMHIIVGFKSLVNGSDTREKK